MKKNGFTTVELIITFSLIGFILIFLFEVVVIVREAYISTGFRTELVNKQANISRIINKELSSRTITNIANCGNECINISFDNGSTAKLEIKREEKLFTFGNYTTELVNNSSFGSVFVETHNDPNVSNSKKNSILRINIPIIHELYKDEDFGINIVYLYDNRVNDLPNFTFN